MSKEPCDNHKKWMPRCDYCRGLAGGKKETARNPHEDDYCIICQNGPTKGRTMHPVASIANGYLCSHCIKTEVKGVKENYD